MIVRKKILLHAGNAEIVLSEKLKALVDKYNNALAIDSEFDELKQIYLQIKALKLKLARLDNNPH